MRHLIFFITFLSFIPVVAHAASETRLVSEGNRLFAEEKYDEALEKYNQAIVESPDSDILQFNRGLAEYRKEDYAAALGSFTKALLTDDAGLESAANYNIANTKYKLGRLKENTDLSTAISLFREALSFYKRAIELNEKDRQAKFNHEFVEKKIKHLLDKLKEQQENQQQKQQGQQQEGEQQEGSSAEGSQGAQAAETEKTEETENAERAQAEEQPQDERSDDGAEEQKAARQDEEDAHDAESQPEASEDTQGEEQTQADMSQPQESDESQMDEDEARMILEGFRDSEEGERLLNQNMEKGRNFEVRKNW